MRKVWLWGALTYWICGGVAALSSRFDIAGYLVGCSIFFALLTEDR